MSLERLVLLDLSRRELLRPGGKVLVGASGGPDSCALLAALSALRASGELDATIEAGHLNHLIRGEEADADERFAEEFARGLGVAFFSRRADVPALARERRVSIEEAAREARMGFFLELARERGARRVALAHTSDDQAETVLFRIVRGTGVEGLAGIPWKRELAPGGPLLIRPLLSTSREGVLDYLRGRDLPYRTDSTNLSEEHARNRLRLKVLPLLEREFNPRAKQALARLAELASCTSEFVAAEAERAFSLCALTREEDRVELDLKELAALHPAIEGEVVRMAFRALAGERGELSYHHLSGVRELLTRGTGKWLDLPNDLSANVSYGKLILHVGRRREAGGPSSAAGYCGGLKDWRATLSVPGEARLPDGRSVRAGLVEVGDWKGLLGRKPASAEAVDYDACGRPGALVARGWRAGDVLRPLGSPGRKKLQDVFTDRKIPREERARAVVFESGGRMLCAAGYCVEEEFRLSASTRVALVVDVRPGPVTSPS